MLDYVRVINFHIIIIIIIIIIILLMLLMLCTPQSGIAATLYHGSSVTSTADQQLATSEAVAVSTLCVTTDSAMERSLH